MNSNKEFILCIKDIKNNETVLKMKNFIQHCDTSCYDHCYKVSLISFLICKKLKLDYKSAARAGFLHDLFLYDWHVKSEEHKPLHGFRHPYIALKNASKLYALSKKEQDIIKKHMWPLTVILPKYTESYIVTFVDKYCATQETLKHYIENKKFQKLYRYAYLFFGLIIFKSI